MVISDQRRPVEQGHRAGQNLPGLLYVQGAPPTPRNVFSPGSGARSAKARCQQGLAPLEARGRVLHLLQPPEAAGAPWLVATAHGSRACPVLRLSQDSVTSPPAWFRKLLLFQRLMFLFTPFFTVNTKIFLIGIPFSL